MNKETRSKIKQLTSTIYALYTFIFYLYIITIIIKCIEDYKIYSHSTVAGGFEVIS